jgi:(p)ppGpp synthase/HD superfamily hydrolase
MKVTPLIEKAVRVSSDAHSAQRRKSTDVPYIIHPFSVMMYASEVTEDESVLVACLLHDVLEDCDPAVYGEAYLRGEFGDRVVDIIKAVTKDDSIKDWRQRNEAYLESIRGTPMKEALIVCAADKIHNLSATLYDHSQIGDRVWERFNAGYDSQVWWYSAVLEVVESRLGEGPLTDKLRAGVDELRRL